MNTKSNYLRDAYLLLSSIAVFSDAISQMLSEPINLENEEEHWEIQLKMQVFSDLSKKNWNEAANKMEVIMNVTETSADNSSETIRIQPSRTVIESWLSNTFIELNQYFKESANKSLSSGINIDIQPRQIPKYLTPHSYPHIFSCLQHICKTQASHIHMPTYTHTYTMTVVYGYSGSVTVTVTSTFDTRFTLPWLRSKIADAVKFPFVVFQKKFGKFVPMVDEHSIIGFKRNGVVEKDGRQNWRSTCYLGEIVAKSHARAKEFKLSKENQGELVSFYHQRNEKVAIISLIKEKGSPKLKGVVKIFIELMADTYSIPYRNGGIASLYSMATFKPIKLTPGSILNLSKLLPKIILEVLHNYTKCKDTHQKHHLKFNYFDHFDLSKQAKLAPPVIHTNPDIIYLSIDKGLPWNRVMPLLTDLQTTYGYRPVADIVYGRWTPTSADVIDRLHPACTGLLLER